jgi:hypothetical protein
LRHGRSVGELYQRLSMVNIVLHASSGELDLDDRISFILSAVIIKDSELPSFPLIIPRDSAVQVFHLMYPSIVPTKLYPEFYSRFCLARA